MRQSDYRGKAEHGGKTGIAGSTVNLLKRNLSHYKKDFILLAAGIFLASSVITGSLLIGGSVKTNLIKRNLERIGLTEWIISSGADFFSVGLASRIRGDLQAVVAQVLAIEGLSVRLQHPGRAQGPKRNRSPHQTRSPQHSQGMEGVQNAVVNNFQVYAIGRSFSDFFSGTLDGPPEDGKVYINRTMAGLLAAGEGDLVDIRLPDIGQVSGEIPLGVKRDSILVTLEIEDVLPDRGAGEFSMAIDQRTEALIYINREYVLELLDSRDVCNLLLIGTGPAGVGRLGRHYTEREIGSALKRNLSLDDIGLRLVGPPGRKTLFSENVFIPDSALEVLAASYPDLERNLGYFITKLSRGGQTVPYLFALAGDETQGAILSDPLRKRLGLHPGDRVDLTYFAIDENRLLVEKHTSIEAAGFTSMEDLERLRRLMPRFPGLDEGGSCSEWSPGFPVDLSLVTDSVEKTWRTYGPTPQVLLPYEPARDFWANHSGSVTSLVFGSGSSGIVESDLEEVLRREIDPVRLGFEIIDLAGIAREAGEKSLDFRSLFAALNSFLIASAFILLSFFIGLFYGRRKPEVMQYVSLGFSPNRIRRIFYRELAAVTTIGVLTGLGGGILFDFFLYSALRTVWIDAVQFRGLDFSVDPVSILAGGCLSAALAAGCSRFMLGRFLKPCFTRRPHPHKKRKPPTFLFLAVFPLLAVFLFVYRSYIVSMNPVIFFFLEGLFVLCGIIFFFRFILGRIPGPNWPGNGGYYGLSFRWMRHSRLSTDSLVIGLGSVIFVILSTTAFYKLPPRIDSPPSSPLGGFQYMVETALPVPTYELPGRDFLVPIRIREGDRASCLNLNSIERPRILGVDPRLLARRGSFSVKAAAAGIPPGSKGSGVRSSGRPAAWDSSWMSLGSEDDRGESVNAFADAAALTWVLKKNLGDSLPFEDETGKPFEIRLSGSLNDTILQGNLIISEEDFLRRFPSSGGYRMFLIDYAGGTGTETEPETAGGNVEEIIGELDFYGADVRSTLDILRELNSVQNTYLAIFLVLGVMALLLAIGCLGIIVSKDGFGEAASFWTLASLGFSARKIFSIRFLHYGIILSAAVLAGTAGGLIATYPVSAATEITAASVNLLVVSGLLETTGLMVIGLSIRSRTFSKGLEKQAKSFHE